MKRKQYSVEQIVAALKQAELGMPVADLVLLRRKKDVGRDSVLFARHAMSVGPGS